MENIWCIRLFQILERRFGVNNIMITDDKYFSIPNLSWLVRMIFRKFNNTVKCENNKFEQDKL